MGKQDIVDRIISDATVEADAIVSAAEETAAKLIAEAEARAESEMRELHSQVESKVKSIYDGKAATARLDGAKIMLGEKRRVLDHIYEQAAKKLSSLDVKSYLALTEALIEKYADEGDEIVFANGFPCAAEVSKLKAVSERKLKITFGATDIQGGFILCGKKSDKDLSFGALLAADRAEHEAEIAAEIFK